MVTETATRKRMYSSAPYTHAQRGCVGEVFILVLGRVKSRSP